MDNANPFLKTNQKIKYPHDDTTSRIMKLIEFVDGDFLKGIPHPNLGTSDPHLTTNEMEYLCLRSTYFLFQITHYIATSRWHAAYYAHITIGSVSYS